METLEQQRADVDKSEKLRINSKNWLWEQFPFHVFQQIFEHLVCLGTVLVARDTAKNNI